MEKKDWVYWFKFGVKVVVPVVYFLVAVTGSIALAGVMAIVVVFSYVVK